MQKSVRPKTLIRFPKLMFDFVRKIVRRSNWRQPAAIAAAIQIFAFGAAGQYQFDQWTTSGGLPQNSVYEIKQTRDGYLWLATLDGLVRFDGVRFTVFNKSNSAGILNNRFVALLEAGGGDLWARTEDGRITRYREEQFAGFDLGQKSFANNIGSIGRDAAGNPLFLFADRLVYRFADEKFAPFDPEIDRSRPAPAALRESLLIPCTLDSEKKQISCAVNGRWETFSAADGLPSLNIVQAAQDAEGTLWLLTADAGLARVENGRVVAVPTQESGLPETPVLLVLGRRLGVLSRNKQGDLWLTDLKSMQSRLLTREPPPLLTDIHRAYQDGEDNLWIGTIRSGLFRARKQAITAYSKADGLSVNNVYPIFEDRRGAIWVGTTKGVFKRDAGGGAEGGGAFTLVESSENFYVDALGEDAFGRVIASSYGALFVWQDGRFKPFYASRLGSVWAIHIDRENALWAGSQEGLARVRDNVETIFTVREGLAGNDVKVIIDDRAGGLWIGSYGGLTHYKDGKFTKWTESEGLPTPTIRALYLDADNALWIGSYDSGLARFKDGKFTHYTTKNGLYSDGAFQILEDARREFWISSNQGIYRVRKDELNEFAAGARSSVTSVAYGRSDGMLSVEANGGRSPGGVKTADGRLWFPTQDGIAVINPETVQINPQPPPVIIEDIKIDNRSVAVDVISSAVRDRQTAIRIEPQQQNFEIKYTAPSFINSENIRFKYKLEGLDADWIDAGTRRTAYFSHVPPGDYVFKVLAANADGIWNEQGASARITIATPFYRTNWFVAFSVFTVFACAYILFKRRLAQLARERGAQQNFTRQLIASQEQERKRIAAELHDSLGQRLVVIKNLALISLGAENGGEKNRIEEISAEASQAIGEVKAISYNLRPYQLDRIGLTKAVEAIVRSAQAASNIRFTAEIGDIDDFFPKDQEINFYRIVQELINNIVKHSEAGEAFVKTGRAGDALELEIRDDGKGFAAVRPEQHAGGFGLIGIAERVELLNGRMEIKSAPEHGATVRITIGNER